MKKAPSWPGPSEQNQESAGVSNRSGPNLSPHVVLAARRLRTQRNDAKFFNDLDDTAFSANVVASIQLTDRRGNLPRSKRRERVVRDVHAALRTKLGLFSPPYNPVDAAAN